MDSQNVPMERLVYYLCIYRHDVPTERKAPIHMIIGAGTVGVEL